MAAAWRSFAVRLTRCLTIYSRFVVNVRLAVSPQSER
jgi:hypothetical protein